MAIWKVSQAILKKEPSIDGMEFAIADIDGMAIELLSVELILEPAFFSRPALIFRLLRQTFGLHNVNSISK